MEYYIFHWFGGKLPENTYKKNGLDMIQIPDLHTFVLKYGPIQLRPPTSTMPFWSIYLTDHTGKFNQK